jgi:FtsP/CotA-like multicopper oxidase with cupredoxin domain
VNFKSCRTTAGWENKQGVIVMNMNKLYCIPFLMLFLLLGSVVSSEAVVDIQCPCDLNGDGDCVDIVGSQSEPDLQASLGVTCMHLGGGDGFSIMADGRPQYMFGFSNLTGIPEVDVMEAGILATQWPAPTIAVNQGDEFYLSLTNVGMVIRPDLFDPHTVHFHGFPQSSTVFDGLPESGIAINMGATLTYYYNLVGPGTFMYHCHVEATEHMQMGMLGNLYVRAAQSWEGYAPNGVPAGNLDECNAPGDQFPGIPCGYTYNDEDGTTAYDLEYPLQLGGFDPDFHDASWNVQPLPFAMMWDRYPMINGRGYPDTVNTGPMPQPMDNGEDLNGAVNSQIENSLITAAQGDRILLRLSNLNITVTHTLISPSIPMTVVGIDAKELRSADGTVPLHYETNSVTMGGGMSVDVILDTAGIAPGTYYLYAANLQYLSNYDEDFGGMMTEIRIQ